MLGRAKMCSWMVTIAVNIAVNRYDVNKSLNKNTALQEPILSRFDMIGIVRNNCDDRDIVKKIIEVHQKACGASADPDQDAKTASTDALSARALGHYVEFIRKNNKAPSSSYSEKPLNEFINKLLSLGGVRSLLFC
jgi:DNA replicative helicase MCM subunit Mcm2 (Cdc46/Mcm family)